MSYYNYYAGYKNIDYNEFFQRVTEADILRSINKNKINEYEFLALLSPLAENYLEPMAQRARQLTLQHFGKTMQLFTPMYVANHCVNRCAYCGFNCDNDINRKKMTLEEVEEEAKAIAATGLRHILFLTGESKKETPVSYVCDVARVLKKCFDSVTIEIYPLTEDEYTQVIGAGVDGLTIYQEVYDEEIYDRVHLAGPKKNYLFRLDAPERGCKAKMSSVNLGALLGLNDWRKEAFATGLHAYYLQNKYTDVEIGVGIPRIRPHVGVFDDVYDVSDKNLVQVLLASRIFLPYASITVTTRERQELRDNLIPLGVTRMSAGVTTEVGGHTSNTEEDGQFEIADERSVEEVKQAISARGYHHVFKNWMSI